MPKAPSAIKRFAPPHPRDCALSTNASTVRSHEYRQSQFGFEAEAQRIKSKYRTRLARAKAKMMVEDRWNTLPCADKERAEKELVITMNQEQEMELRKAVFDWGKVMKGELSIGGDDDEEAKEMDRIKSEIEYEKEEWEEWNKIEDDNVEINESEHEEGSSGWETENEESDLKTEEFVDDEGNPICLEEVKGDLNEIYDRHMAKLQKKLMVFQGVAKLEHTGK